MLISVSLLIMLVLCIMLALARFSSGLWCNVHDQIDPLGQRFTAFGPARRNTGNKTLRS